MPKISVIVPVYKVEPYIHRCVDSILSQTYSDFELILVDDGSPDNCGKICDEYAEKDARVVVIHQKNGGLSAARNAGIDWTFAHSASEWMTFIDSDDWVHPKYLEVLLKAANSTGKDVIVGGYAGSFGENPWSEICEDIEIITDDVEKLFCTKNEYMVTAWGKLYKKRTFFNYRYPVGVLNEDAFITHKIIFEQDCIVFIDFPLYVYFQNEQGIMRSAWTPARLAEGRALEEQREFFIKNGYKMAEKSIAYRLVLYYAYSINRVSAFGKKYKRYIYFMRKRLQRLLHLYENEIKISENEVNFVNRMAHPIFFEIKRFIRKKISSLRYIINKH